RRTATFELLLESATGKGHQALAAALMGTPQFGVGNVIDPLPNGVVRGALFPLDAEVAVVELDHFGSQPRARVDAVGDRADRHLGFREIGPEVAPHLA